MPRGLKWIEGDVFGKLTVWQYLGTGTRGALWHCQCECGKLRVVAGSDLRSGAVKSCGKCRDGDERFLGTLQQIRAPCDMDCHFRGHCMTEKLACWVFEMWVKHGTEKPPDPESYKPNSAIYRRLFPNDKQSK